MLQFFQYGSYLALLSKSTFVNTTGLLYFLLKLSSSLTLVTLNIWSERMGLSAIQMPFNWEIEMYTLLLPMKMFWFWERGPLYFCETTSSLTVFFIIMLKKKKIRFIHTKKSCSECPDIIIPIFKVKSTDGGRQCGFAERWILSAIQFIFKMNEHIHYFHSYVFANRQIQPGMLSGDKQLRISIIIIIIILINWGKRNRVFSRWRRVFCLSFFPWKADTYNISHLFILFWGKEEN